MGSIPTGISQLGSLGFTFWGCSCIGWESIVGDADIGGANPGAHIVLDTAGIDPVTRRGAPAQFDFRAPAFNVPATV